MPPKKPAAEAAAAPPPPPPPSAAVVAAQQVVDKWSTRVEDAAKRVASNLEQLSALAAQKQACEQKLRDLFAEVSVIALPKPPEPEAPPAKGAKAPKKGEAPPPPPPPPDEEEVKRLHKLQHAVTAIYKKKRERPLVRETPPPTAESTASRKSRPDAGASAAASTVGDAASDAGGKAADETPVPAPVPAVPEEPGIVKPADLDAEIWARVLKLRDERIDTEEALATVMANQEVAEGRRKNLQTLEQVTAYSLDAARFQVEKAKEAKPDAAEASGSGAPPPPTPGGTVRRPSNSQRPPSQLLRR